MFGTSRHAAILVSSYIVDCPKKMTADLQLKLLTTVKYVRQCAVGCQSLSYIFESDVLLNLLIFCLSILSHKRKEIYV